MMNDAEFMALKEEVDRLYELHMTSFNDPSISLEQKQAIAADYTNKYRELDHASSERISEYRDCEY
ncbi:hypothetical protein [Tatumella sp. JGM118]|uniref:hypothetical protein n=1 Tax=Tatumella sp. JGM118 TaxID=2799796 RepID=UPI001BAF23FA|nr:hypothetical protein [Tatumella sp. JGM118]MBS0908543.1 hypothetical protein [Tatumella sp. JGM118]